MGGPGKRSKKRPHQRKKKGHLGRIPLKSPKGGKGGRGGLLSRKYLNLVKRKGGGGPWGEDVLYPRLAGRVPGRYPLVQKT